MSSGLGQEMKEPLASWTKFASKQKLPNGDFTVNSAL
jgi:hypothetical protein